MRLYVIEIMVDAQGGIARQITPSDNMDDAKMLFHQVLASAYANVSVIKEALVMIVDGHGNFYEKDHFEREIQA